MAAASAASIRTCASRSRPISNACLVDGSRRTPKSSSITRAWSLADLWPGRHERRLPLKYTQPIGITDPNAPFINGDPSIGRAGSIPPAEAIEYPQREIVKVITSGGFAADNADLAQLARSIQRGKLIYGAD